MEPRPTPESKRIIPTSIYAVNKRDQEEMVLVTGRTLGIPTVAMRFFNVYGDRQALSNPYTGVAAIFSSALLNRRAPLIFEDGRQSRDFIHVSDLVEGCVKAIEAEDVADDVFNLGTGTATDLNTLLALLKREIPTAADVRAAGPGPVPRRRHPVLLRRHHAGPRAPGLPAEGDHRGRACAAWPPGCAPSRPRTARPTRSRS